MDKSNTLCSFIDDFKKILSKQMKKRLDKLDRDVQFLRLELDKLQTKDKEGKLTQAEAAQMTELAGQISTRRKTFFMG